MSTPEIIYLKVSIVMIFVGMAIGAWKGRQEGIAESVVSAISWGAMSGGGMFLLVLPIQAVAFLFS